MFDLGGWELFLVAALALIVVGPKDLPKLVRNVGRWVAKARGLAREFQSGMEEAARDADLDELKKIGNIKTGVRDQVRGIGRDIAKMADPNTPAPSSSGAKASAAKGASASSGRASAGSASTSSSAATTSARSSAASDPSKPGGPAQDLDDEAFLDNFTKSLNTEPRDG